MARDVLAVIEAIGEPVRYVGHSYGALIGMEVLARTDRVERALLYEPPFNTPGHVVAPLAALDDISELLAAGERERALEVFYREVLGTDATPFKALPMWPTRVAIAPSRAAAEAARAAIPGSEVVLLEGEGHTMIDTDPAGFVRRLVDFLDR